MYFCDICGDFVNSVYVDLQTGLYLCPDCYFADDDENELDTDDDFDAE